MSRPVIFTGAYPCLVDDKGRLVIPKGMRVQVPSEEDGAQKYWVTLMLPERCVAVYPDDSWKGVLAKRFEEMSGANSPEQRERLRVLMEKTYPVRPDGQGRFKIHPALIRAAGLQGRLLVIGFGDHVEYWAVERRQQYALSMGTSDDAAYADYAEATRDEGDADGVAER